MAQCIVVNATGQLETTTADPCTTLLVLTPPEYAALNASPLNLSAEDGLTLSVAIVGVWSVAWALRALVHSLNTDGEVNE
jgi:hypothetical protein